MMYHLFLATATLTHLTQQEFIGLSWNYEFGGPGSSTSHVSQCVVEGDQIKVKTSYGLTWPDSLSQDGAVTRSVAISPNGRLMMFCHKGTLRLENLQTRKTVFHRRDDLSIPSVSTLATKSGLAWDDQSRRCLIRFFDEWCVWDSGTGLRKLGVPAHEELMFLPGGDLLRFRLSAWDLQTDGQSYVMRGSIKKSEVRWRKTDATTLARKWPVLQTLLGDTGGILYSYKPDLSAITVRSNKVTVTTMDYGPDESSSYYLILRPDKPTQHVGPGTLKNAPFIYLGRENNYYKFVSELDPNGAFDTLYGYDYKGSVVRRLRMPDGVRMVFPIYH